MAYMTSNNLKTALKLKNPIYQFISEDDDSDVDSYFCGECRKIFSSKKEIKITCPYCGFHSKTDLSYNFFGNEYYIDNIIDGITVNESFHDDESIKDINITILYRSYRIACDTHKQISWQYYNRMLFNFETKQVYYTQKLLLSKNVEFSHFLLHKEFSTELSEFSPMIQQVITEIYKVYGFEPHNNVNKWYNSIPKNMRSPAVAFMCLKFPVMMNFAYDLLTGYKRITNHYCTVDVHFAIIYWACNYDRVLKAALTSTKEHEYIERTDEIISKMTNDKQIIQSVRYNPLYVVYSRYMYCLGFREFDSVERIVNTMSVYSDVHTRHIGIFVLDISRKRTHVRNKMYRLLLKVYTEDEILNSICNSHAKCLYKDFHGWSGYPSLIDNFYNLLEQQLKHNVSTHEIYDDLIDMCNR